MQEAASCNGDGDGDGRGVGSRGGYADVCGFPVDAGADGDAGRLATYVEARTVVQGDRAGLARDGDVGDAGGGGDVVEGAKGREGRRGPGGDGGRPAANGVGWILWRLVVGSW